MQRESEEPWMCSRDEDWQENNGALNTILQLYPGLSCVHSNCEIGEDLNDLKDGRVLQAGIWSQWRGEVKVRR
uniref:Uncharacterized protein n=1 Tax=Physcomitrium patens TaxID=3218 RepID=A0A2K1J1T6_PHYPA|nr:hypothetical protein PHYPA_023388 [Physcomitrium patens]